MFSLRRAFSRRICVLLVVGLSLTMAARSDTAFAAASVKAEAQGLSLNVSVIGGLISVPASTTRAVWTGAGSAVSGNVLAVNALPLARAGAITATAGPGTVSGGRARADVAGLSLLADAVSTGPIRSSCTMDPTGITTNVTVADLKLGGNEVLNPDVNLAVNIPNVASVTVDKRTASWNSGDGRYTYTVRALDVGLLQGVLGGLASGSIVVAEAQCSGIIRLGPVTTTPVALAPGQSGTPKVTVTNSGDVGAPNTTVRIPKPGPAYVLDPPTVTGGGTCVTTDPNFIECTGITVPGSGSAVVSLPVRLKASAPTGADGWLAGPSAITVTSTPVAQLPAQKQTLTGGGDLVTAQPRTSTGGSVTIAPVTLPAGKTATTGITVANAGPSDASTTIVVPIGNRPAGITVDAAAVGNTPCTVTASTITCSGVTVPAGGDVTVTVTTAAEVNTAAGTTWDLAAVSAPMNNTPVGGQGRLVTVGSPEVNLSGGVTITPASVIPGGPAATARVRVANSGTAASVPGTITIPAPPTGYTVTGVSVTGGGSCTTGVGPITCNNVTVPAGGAVTVTMSVSVGAGVSAGWTAAAGAPVRAAAGTLSGTATGPIAVLTPRYTLGVTASGPADGTVSPGQTTSITAQVYNQGPSNATQGTFTVVAPAGATFGTLTGTAAQICVASAYNTLLTCTADIAAGGAGLSLTLPLVIDRSADPATPVAGGCVSLDGDTTCSGADDARLPAITLRAALADRLTIGYTPATVTPGAIGTGRLTLRSTRAETGLTVTVPTAGLPAGFRVVTATVPGGLCTGPPTSAITCTTDLSANTAKDISVQIGVDAGVTPPQAWTATGVTIAAGNETATSSGVLAGTGNVSYALTATAGAPANDSVEPGGTTSMTFSVTNPGPSSAPAAAFRVLAPAGTTFGAYTGPVCQVSTPTLLLCTAVLPAGAGTGVLTVPLTVAANADIDQPISGGCVDINGIPGCGSGDRTIPSFTLRAPLSAQVQVTADRADVVPGGTATAKVHVKALRGALSGVDVTIPESALPAGMTIDAVSGPTSCTDTGPAWTCTGVSVAAGATEDIEITVRAGQAMTPGTNWTVTDLAVATGGRTVTSAQTLATVAAAQPGLSATAQLSGLSALPGGTGTLRVDLTNNGPSNAVNTAVDVVAPAGTEFTSVPGGCTLSADRTRATCTVNLTVGATTAQPLDLGVRISPNALPGKAITGGCVELSGNSTCGAGDVLIPVITVGVPLAQRLDVTTTPARIVPGESADAQITLRSSAAETGLTVTVPLTAVPAGTTVTSAAVAGGSCMPLTSPIVCTGVGLTAGVATTVTLRVDAGPGATPGTWTASGISVAGGGQTATANGNLAVVGTPRSALTGTVPAVSGAGTVAPGGTANVTVTVTNTGPSDAAAAVFTVSAPAGTTFDDTTLPAICVVNAAGTVATCTTALADGAGTGPLTFDVRVPPDADPFRPLTGGCVDLDGVPGCGPEDEAVPDITLDVPFDRSVTAAVTPATVVPGRTGTATLRLTAEDTPLTGLAVTVPLPAPATGLTLTSVTGGACAQTPPATGPWVCTGLGTPATLTLNLSAAANATPGTVWNATGIVVGDGTDSISLDRRLASVGPADVALGATVSMPGPLEPGESGPVGLTLANNGDSDLPGASVVLVPPTGAAFGPLPAACATIGGSAGQIRCTATVPGQGAAPQIVIPLRADPAASPGTTLTGGCVDLGGDGLCQIPPDVALGPVPVATPFAQQIEVRTNPVTVSPGTSGDAEIEIVARQGQAQPVSLLVPVGSLPAGITAGTPVTAPAGATCGINGGDLTCTGISLPADGDTATVGFRVDVDNAAGTGLLGVLTGITVTSAASETATGGGLLVRTGAPAYTLGATFRGPDDDTALPGGTVTLTADVGNTGNGPATGVPIIVRAPDGTTFADAAQQPAGCSRVSSTMLSCAVTVAAGAGTPLAVKVVIPDPPPGATISGGCVDLGGDGRCDPSDVALTPFTLRAPLTGVIAFGAGTAPAVTPGRSDTATLHLTASATRNDLTLTVTPSRSPLGLEITAATVGSVPCDVTAGAVTCNDVDFPNGATRTLTMTVAAGPDAVPGGTWAPAVALTAGAPDTVVGSQPIATVGAADNGTGLRAAVAVPATGVVLPGGSNVLRLTMTNPGPSAMPGARVTVRAPIGVTFGALEAPASTYCVKASPTTVTCTADLGVESRLLRLPIDVPAGATPGGTIDGGCVDENEDGVCDAGDTPIAAFDLGKLFGDQARLTLVAGTVTPGATADAVVRLTSDRALSGLTATIPFTGLPAGLTVTGAAVPTGTCTVTGAVTCTGITAGAGPADLITVTLRAAPDTAAGETWAGATVTLTNPSGATTAVTGVLMRTGEPDPGLAFEVSAPDGTVAPGSKPVMRVLVKRTGPSDADGARVRLRAPTGTTFDTLSGDAAADCVVLAADRLECSVDLAGGDPPKQWDLRVQVPVNADPNSTLTGGCVGEESCDTVFPALRLTPRLAQGVTLTLTDAPVIQPGRTGIVTVTVGATWARDDLAVHIPLSGLPAGMGVLRAEAPGARCDVTANAVACSGVGVGSGGDTALTLHTEVRGTATPADVWSAPVTVTEAADSLVRTFSLATVGAADTAVTVSVAVPTAYTMRPGGTGELAVTLANSGSSVSRGGAYSFLAPAGTTFVPPTGTTASFCVVAAAGARMDCTADVAGNARVQLPLPLRVAPNADVRTRLTGGCHDVDRDGACTAADRPIPDIQLAQPLADMVRISGVTATVTPGTSGAGVVRVTSLVALTGATVTVPLDGLLSGMTYVGATGPAGSTCARSGNQVTCTGINLVAGDNSAVSITVRVDPASGPGVTWSPSAVLTAAGETVSGAAGLITVGTASSAVAWSVTGAGGTVRPGATQTLTVTATNPGPSNVRGGTVAVVAPAGTTFGPLTGAAAAACKATGKTLLTCTYDLATGAGLSWPVPLVVDSDAREGARLTGGCVSTDGNETCGSGDVALDPATVARTLRDSGTITVAGTVIERGTTGTATVTVAATSAFRGLTLTVPLSGLPAGFTVTGARLGDTDCAVGAGEITCRGVDLAAGTPQTLGVRLKVDATAAPDAVWRATGITLSGEGEPGVTGAGLLAGTSAATTYQVSVSLGAPSVTTPTRAETTVLPITAYNAGPGAADPYPMTVLLPAGTTHGPLPAGCAEGGSARIVVCEVTLAAGATARIDLPLVIGADVEEGSVITGGCLDQALTTGPPEFDLACGGTGDIRVPDFTVGRFEVDLGIAYPGGTVVAPAGGSLVVKLQYDNRGTETADNVRFTIVPPAGVTVTSVQVVLAEKELSAAADSESAVVAECEPAPDVAANAVICAGPDEDTDMGRQLWVTLGVGAGAVPGEQPMRVTITTTDVDGYTDDNWVDVPLRIAGDEPDGGDGGDDGDGDSGGGGSDDDKDLPTTGAQIVATVTLATLMVGTGAGLLIAGRDEATSSRRYRGRHSAGRVT